MKIGGYNTTAAYSKFGPALLIASCVILAIRTAKWAAMRGDGTSQRDLEAEVDHAIHAADSVLGRLLARKGNLFPSKQEP